MTMLHRRRERERRRGEGGSNDSNPSSPGRSPTCTSTTTTMSGHSKFYVPFLIVGMIFTVRSNSYPLVLATPHQLSPRVPATRSGPSTRTSSASRTVTQTTPCFTSSPSGRPCRCSARPFLVHLPAFSSLTNHVLQLVRCYASITSSSCTVLG